MVEKGVRKALKNAATRFAGIPMCIDGVLQFLRE